MTSPEVLHAGVIALLRVGHVTIYDGDVIAKPPADSAGIVKPYAVVFSGAGQPTARNLAQSSGSLLWTTRIQAAGGDITRALQAAAHVRSKLVGKTVATCYLIENDLGVENALIDRDVNPARFFLPLSFSAFTA